MEKLFLLPFFLTIGCDSINTSKNLTKIDSLTIMVKEQQEYIQDLKYQIDVLRSNLNDKEDEISYLGHKLDSISKKR